MTDPFDFILSTVSGAMLLILAYMTAWFAIALLAKRNDLADVAWGLGFVVVTGWLLLRDGAPLTARQYLASALVAVWGLRLAWHVARRNLRPGRGEDPRYAAWRRDWGRAFVPRSYVQVWLLQGFFMLAILTPVIVIGANEGPAGIGTAGVLGLTVWLAGFAFESVGDAQLARFLKDPANRGKIMDRGLWAWTRHPNYFGEATMWWGIAVIAQPMPEAWIALFGPATITWLLLKVSGVPLLERAMEGRAGWAEYAARTSVFFPLPPKKG